MLNLYIEVLDFNIEEPWISNFDIGGGKVPDDGRLRLQHDISACVRVSVCAHVHASMHACVLACECHCVCARACVRADVRACGRACMGFTEVVWAAAESVRVCVFAKWAGMCVKVRRQPPTHPVSYMCLPSHSPNWHSDLHLLEFRVHPACTRDALGKGYPRAHSRPRPPARTSATRPGGRSPPLATPASTPE